MRSYLFDAGIAVVWFIFGAAVGMLLMDFHATNREVTSYREGKAFAYRMCWSGHDTMFCNPDGLGIDKR